MALLIVIGKAMHCSFNQRGFVYMALLFWTAIVGVTLAASALIWSQSAQREKERELLFVGNALRQAIAAYYESTPGTVKRFPANLNELLKDERRLTIVRHLRKIYVDPMANKADWGIVAAPDGGVMGVYSFSTQAPLKRAGFSGKNIELNNQDSYSKWRFVYRPPLNEIGPTQIGNRSS